MLHVSDLFKGLIISFNPKSIIVGHGHILGIQALAIWKQVLIIIVI